jgi:hypothetical protein
MAMGKFIFVISALVLSSGSLAGAAEKGGSYELGAAKVLQTDRFGERALLNINNMSMWFTRDGSSAYNPLTSGSGVTFPRSTDQVIYKDGLIWGGIVKDGDPQELRVGGQTYEIGTVPGRIISKGVAEDPSDPSVRIYRVRTDYATADLKLDASELFGVGLSEVTDADEEDLRLQYAKNWREWPAAKGAPFYDRDGNGRYDPNVDTPSFRDADCTATPDVCEANADQVAWYVINDLDVGAVQSLYGSKPIGLEVQNTLWGYARTDALGDAIFKKYKVIYKGTETAPDDAVIEDMYFAQWSDPDLGDFGDDFAGADTELSLGYVYNSVDSDSHYRTFDLAPPAAGYDFLQGPIVEAEGEEAIFNFRKRSGFRNLPMTSFVFFAAGSAISDPDLGEYVGTEQWYNLLRGFQPQPDIFNPVDFVNPLNNQPTKFTLDGDPTTTSGWNDGIPLPAGDRRIVLDTGPFQMALGDTQEVVIALVAGISTDRLRSVSKLKFNDQFVQEAYDNFFDVAAPPVAPQVRVAQEDGAITLDWGWNLPALEATEDGVEAPFAFEGYNVYQFPSAEADLSQAVKIATYDVSNGVQAILGKTLDDRSGVIVSVPQQIGTDSGVQWVSTIKKDAIRGGPLVNGQTYHFAVTAYSFNGSEGAVVTTLESVAQKFSAVPQTPKPGVRRTAKLDSVLEVRHTTGSADAVVTASVVAPEEVINARYRVFFNANQTWGMQRNGNIVLNSQSNFSLDESYLAVDGIQVKVGELTFDPPPTYLSAGTTVDADPSDGDLSLWGDGTLFGYATGAGDLFNGGGGEAALQSRTRDIEFRFTGVMSADGSEVVEGGSFATLTGVSGGSGERDIDAHPFRPAGAPATGPFLQRVPFEIWDVDDAANPRQINGTFFDRGADGSRDDGSVAYHKTYNMNGRDYITVVHSDYDPNTIFQDVDPNTTWTLFFEQGGNSVASTGDVFRVNYLNSIVVGEDAFEFNTAAPTFSLADAKVDVEKVNVFPNPYYGVNTAETSRYNSFITFSHLPDRATIRIFDLGGTLVRVIEKDDSNQFLEWDLSNDHELPVASGMYVVHINMPDVGDKILKLAIIQEQQFLENF